MVVDRGRQKLGWTASVPKGVAAISMRLQCTSHRLRLALQCPQAWPADTLALWRGRPTAASSCAKRGAVDRGASRVHLSTGSRCRCSRGNLGSSSPRTRGSRPLATEAGIFWAPAFAGATTTDAAGNVLFLASVSAPLRDAGALEDTWIRHPRERGDPALCRRRPALSRPPSPPARGQPPRGGDD